MAPSRRVPSGRLERAGGFLERLARFMGCMSRLVTSLTSLVWRFGLLLVLLGIVIGIVLALLHGDLSHPADAVRLLRNVRWPL